MVLLALAGALVFAGFAVPFAIESPGGWMLGVVLVAIGAAVLWSVEKRTAHLLEKESVWNRTMKADGRSLIEPPSDQDL